MRNLIFIPRSLMALILCAVPVFGQQSTTNTNCNVYGQQVNCTSNTTSTDAQRAEQQREMNEAGKAIGTAAGTIIGNKILKKRVSKWCEEHPEGSWNFANGQNVTCYNWNEAYQPAANTQLKAQLTDQMVTIAVAAHEFCTQHPDQSWTGPVSGKVTACGQLVALQDVQCSRNPEWDICKAIANAKAPVLAAASVSPTMAPGSDASTSPTPTPAITPVSSVPPASTAPPRFY